MKQLFYDILSTYPLVLLFDFFSSLRLKPSAVDFLVEDYLSRDESFLCRFKIGFLIFIIFPCTKLQVNAFVFTVRAIYVFSRKSDRSSL